jgi:transcriptional regulator with XRE-family HTH domain
MTDPSVEQRQRALIGAKLRAMRRDRGMTLAEAAAASGLSRSFISMVESGSSEIAVSRLIRLADAYGALVADLLADVHGTATAEFVASGEGHVVPGRPDGVTVEYLASGSWPVQPFRVSLPEGGTLENLVHPGAEFLHCVAGSLVLTVAGSEYPMSPGDTIVIPDHAEHSYRNTGGGEATLIGGVERSG